VAAIWPAAPQHKTSLAKTLIAAETIWDLAAWIFIWAIPEFL
jgi:hypothetical protein